MGIIVDQDVIATRGSINVVRASAFVNDWAAEFDRELASRKFWNICAPSHTTMVKPPYIIHFIGSLSLFPFLTILL